MNYDARFVVEEQINTSMPNYVVKKIGIALNTVKKAINGSTVVVLGVAYKPNINDVRESPALAIISQLQRLGANVTYNDDYIPTISLSKDQSLSSIPLSDLSLSTADCVVMVTNHSYYNIADIVASSPLIVDTRNATKGMSAPTIIKL